MIQKPKCEFCDDECGNDATFKCSVCGKKYCKECAQNADYECDCQEVPYIMHIEDESEGDR